MISPAPSSFFFFWLKKTQFFYNISIFGSRTDSILEVCLTRVRNNAFRENRETVIDDNELGRALDQANAIDNEYFRLRAVAVLSLL